MHCDPGVVLTKHSDCHFILKRLTTNLVLSLLTLDYIITIMVYKHSKPSLRAIKGEDKGMAYVVTG